MKTEVLLKALTDQSVKILIFSSRNCQAYIFFRRNLEILSSQHNPEKGIKLIDFHQKFREIIAKQQW